MGVYDEAIARIAGVLERVMGGREARLIATLLYLTSQYGKGDALAGYYLEYRFGDVRVQEGLLKLLKRCGVKVPDVKPTRLSPYAFYAEVFEHADFNDEQVNRFVRELLRTGNIT